ncbi:response regulator [Spirosoma sp. KUDC1026]|uniref:response regulator n=1 Tax=Spirosoma sp. KUDC1026 TaxID=2745947 RepID=UPI00159BB30A|nr:response regulator [Spirosoma sp. KUDC1026]QKZ13817.1 response regulator [Spirosoma sp. KUDC1026]
MNEPYRPPATTRRNVQRTKILIIDDNLDQCDIIQTVLHDCMPEVDLLIALTGEAAFSQLHHCLEAKQKLPRLILLDLYLPLADDGLRIIERIKRKDSPYRLIPIALLSQSARQPDVQRGYELGANSYIVKPASHAQWLLCMKSLREYWLHTVTLPPG